MVVRFPPCNDEARLRRFICTVCRWPVSHLSSDKVDICPVCRAGKAGVPVEEPNRPRWWGEHV